MQWARKRANFSHSQLANKLKLKPEAIETWERSGEITFSRVNALAKHTYTPLGYLYLSEPPDDSLPIKDFRTRSDSPPQRPSPDLLETVYQMMSRQEWLKDEILYYGSTSLDFVGAFNLNSPPQEVVAVMNEVLQLKGGWAKTESNWTDALRTLRDCIDAANVLVFFNGIVGNNTRRKLDPEEFQGFALVDELAPLIFVNNADYKTAQIFTLAHELAHIFVGESGLSKFEDLSPTGCDHHATEEACNRIAAEFLVPTTELCKYWKACHHSSDPSKDNDTFKDVAINFKVSTVVAARRALDAKIIGRERFFNYYNQHKHKTWTGRTLNNARTGGNFWTNQYWRLGPRFANAVNHSLAEGRTTYTEAFKLTGLKAESFFKMPQKMGLHL